MSLSDRCNLRCPFCYARDGRCAGPDMDRTRATIRWFVEQAPTMTPKVAFFGGEPLLEWDDLQEAVGWTEATYPERTFQWSVVTNMTLLDADKLDWLVAHGIRVSPSIDGNPSAEDAHRRLPNGRGVSGIVYENARRLLSRQRVSCRMTVTPDTAAHLCDSVIFLCDNIGFRTVNAVLAGGVPWTGDAVATLKAETTRLTDWWIDKCRAGKWIGLYHLANMQRGLWSAFRKRGLCDAGVSTIAVDTMGNLWPCHRFCGPASDPAYRLGSLDDGYANVDLFNRLRTFDLAKRFQSQCARCPAVLGCHHFCIHETMLAKTGQLAAARDYTCSLWPHYWSEALRAHAILTAEKNRLYIQRMMQERKDKGQPMGGCC